jgi:hypothetical protein
MFSGTGSCRVHRRRSKSEKAATINTRLKGRLFKQGGAPAGRINHARRHAASPALMGSISRLKVHGHL